MGEIGCKVGRYSNMRVYRLAAVSRIFLGFSIRSNTNIGFKHSIEYKYCFQAFDRIRILVSSIRMLKYALMLEYSNIQIFDPTPWRVRDVLLVRRVRVHVNIII